MKQIKKLLSACCAMMLCVCLCQPMSVRAETFADRAKDISAMEYVSGQFTDDVQAYYYRLVIEQSGKVYIHYGNVDNLLTFRLLDSNGNKIKLGSAASMLNSSGISVTPGTYFLELTPYSYMPSRVNYYEDVYYTFKADNTPLVTITTTLKVGKTLKLGSEVKYSKASPSWTSSKSSVATVSSKGVVKGISAGTAIIKAKLATGEYAAIKVKVVK